MYIEIKGTSFLNKGAELMLHAILQEVKKRLPEAKFVHAAKKSAPYEERARLGLYQKIWFPLYGIPLGLYFDKFILKELRRYFGIVTHKEIKIVFDASGFSYSDQGARWATVATAKACRKWKQCGTKIIFLPQAFGPFNKKKNQKAFKSIVNNSDLIFARDKISYNYVTELCGERSYISLAPDFTNLLNGVKPAYFDSEDKRICIVPNYRMIDKTDIEEYEYFDFLLKCIKCLQKKGESVFFLIHEGKRDLYCANKVVDKLEKNKDVEIITEKNPLEIKGIIKNCRGVITSRFHGLVSALSQGIPALCTVWSHKYKMLLEDYKFSEGFLTVKMTDDKIRRKIDLITKQETRCKIKNNLLAEAKQQKKLAEKMWSEIFYNINI